jgi:cytoskeletal protein RodZ
MIFKRTVTKKEKRNAAKKRLLILLIFVGLISLNILFFYKVFIEKPSPIITPLSGNQISSTSIVEKMLKEEKINYKSFETQKDLSYLIKMKDGGEVIIDSSKDIDQQISSLQLILSQLKIEGKTLKRLDYRFDKPTITF